MSTGPKAYFVYLLECRDGRLYTGIATDPERRFEEHLGGKRGAKFTRANPPVRLLAVEPVEGRSAAQQLEARVKRLDRQQKLIWAGLQSLKESRS